MSLGRADVKLTAANIRILKLPPGVTDKVFFDESLPGFGLRVRASGVHSWMVQYAIAGRTRRIVLGLETALDPGKARATAKDLLAQVRLGRDPAGEKDRARMRAAETFGALLPRFLERQRKRQKPRSYVETERHLTKHLKALHAQPIEGITRRTIASRLAEIARRNGPAACNRVRASLSAYFTWAAREGYIDANPVAFTNKADENGARERVLSDEELRTIWLALPNGTPPDGAPGARPMIGQYGAIIKLLILTGARRNEITDLRWSEVDPDAATITLPPARTKSKREHVIPVPEPALRILQAQPRRTQADGTPRDHVFGVSPGRGFQDWSGSKKNIDARIAEAGHGQIPDWRLHDFRRSLSTSLHDRFGVPPHVVEVILGHVGGHKRGVAGTYNKALYLDERRRAMERWGAHMMNIVSGKPAKGKILELRGRRM
jgi:integrase